MTTATINTQCPNCRKTIKATPAFVGKRVKCPGCQGQFTVSVMDDEFDPDNPFGNDPVPAAAAPPPIAAPVAAPEPMAPDPFEHEPFQQPTYNAYAPVRRPPSNLPEERHYPALQFIRKVLLILTIIVAVVWVGMQLVSIGSVVVAFMMPAPSLEGVPLDMQQQVQDMRGGVRTASLFLAFIYAIATFIAGAIICLALMTVRELIAVVLHIQENTLAAARS